ncbi:MAG TPA: M13 family metallopeptidase [Acidobacteriaceae bacterium]|nr:M13 family metallopeptidase [Acidobacteriaceae bacterium]
MKKLSCIVVAGLMAVMLPGAGAGLAQAQAKKTAGAEAPKPLPPGLDTQWMDTSVNPCTNFYQYACGNFLKHNPIPADLPMIAPYILIYVHTQAVVHHLLEQAAVDSASRTPDEQKIGDYYATCMDTQKIYANGLKPLEPELRRIADLKSKQDLTPLLAQFQMTNVGAFFGYGEQQDFKNAQDQIAVVDQGGLGLPERGYYLRTDPHSVEARQKYEQYAATMLHLAGEPEAKAESDAKTILKFETALAKISMSVTERRDPKKVYHIMTVAELSKLAPVIDWTELIKLTNTPKVTSLNVTNPDFFKGMQALIASTDLATIKTYLKWQYIHAMPSWTLPKAMDEARFNFYGRYLEGDKVQPVRWKRCVSATNGAVGMAVGKVYVEKNFTPEQRAYMVKMVHDIEAAMGENIHDVSWMSAETKTKAEAKLHMVRDKIGYPNRFRDYSKLTIVRGDAVGDALRAAEFENHRELNKIGKPVNRDEWGMSPQTVNAYYNPSMNDINFPAGYLQSPEYNAKSTDAENYGHIGATVGHELTHGFDDQGRLFDGHGNMVEWWTPADAKNYKQQASCIVNEYGNFTAVGKLKVNGKLTEGENIADNGGIRLAYMAFLADAHRKGIDLKKKDKYGYTPIQEFFLAFGQDWCGEMRPALTRLLVQTDPHSPDRIRANGVVQNMPQMGKAFGCKVGDPMMPAHTCRVW